jgi:hypothetical protein
MANRASDGGNHMYGHVLIELSELNMLSTRQLAHMLEYLYLNNNGHEGEVPSSFAELPSLLLCNL